MHPCSVCFGHINHPAGFLTFDASCKSALIDYFLLGFHTPAGVEEEGRKDLPLASLVSPGVGLAFPLPFPFPFRAAVWPLRPR